MKKIISILISAALLLCVCAPAACGAEKTAFIVVSGMNTFPLNGADGEKLYPLPTSSILGAVNKLIAPVSLYLLNKDADALGEKLLPALYEMFESIRCDENGNSVNDVDTVLFDKALTDCADTFTSEEKDELAVVRAGMERFGTENTFFFNYDWRIDPLVHADRLNSFIKTVRQTTGCTRVAVAAFSMGGTVVCSYLYKYGSADIDSLSLCSTAFQGTSCVGSLFKGDVALDMNGLMRRLAQLTRDKTAENLVYYLNIYLQRSGFNGKISDFANGLVGELADRLYPELLTPVFGTMPGLWALCDDADYDDAKAFMLDTTVNAALLSRIDEYHYNVQQKAFELLNDAKSDTDVYIIAQYNMQGLPVSETASDSNNDFLIDAEYASGGAVCAKLGEKLPADYRQAVNCGHSHLSADGQIDASTCMFPETTWFIRDMGHVDYPYGGGCDMILEFAASPEQLTVETSAYPQFTQYSYSTNRLVPVTEQTDNTPADAAFRFFAELAGRMFDLLDKIARLFRSPIC